MNDTTDECNYCCSVEGESTIFLRTGWMDAGGEESSGLCVNHSWFVGPGSVDN